jgi:DNA-binding CsgD family transcriptional regulator
MSGGSRSAGLLGRELEQTELYDVLSQALKGDHQIVVVAGDAGVGKTTLVADLARRAEELGFTVALGHCLDVGADISFAPVIEAVGALVGGVDDLGARPYARRMSLLLDPEKPGAAGRLNVLDDLRQTVLEAAAEEPVLLVLEDMHWADRSTQDLAVALSRTARGRLMLAATVRTDDLHRRHPARLALSEIVRLPAGRRLDLEPLGHDAIAGIVESVSGAPPDPATVRSVLERSEGNALYAEEIAAAGPQLIPVQLSDLFLARIDALTPAARELARTASVDGTRVDAGILAELAGVDRRQLSGLLHELLDANVLRNVGGSLAFRHGLLREAVYDDLLPDERARLHAELGAILQARADTEPEPRLSLLSRLAFHWYAAHDLPRTLAASVRAGLVAWRVGAAESIAHRERALSLWHQVPDAASWAGCSEVELVLDLARSTCDHGDLQRWHELNVRAVDLLEPGVDPMLASRAHSAFAYSGIFNEDRVGATAAIRRAVELAGESPTEELAYAFGAQALLHNVSGRFVAGLEAATRTVETARIAGSADVLLLGLMFKTDALKLLGRMSEASAAAGEVIDEARAAGLVEWTLESVGLLAGCLMDSGDVAQGISVARAGYREGLAGQHTIQATCGENLVTALLWAGRLESAGTLLTELRGISLPQARWRRLKGELAVARGDVDTATQVALDAAITPELAARHPDDVDVLRELRLADLRGDREKCLDVAEAFLGQLEDCDSPLLAAAAARVGFQALVLGRSVTKASSSLLRARATEFLAQAHRGLTDEWRGSYYGVDLAIAEGYAARVEGRPAIEEFRAALDLSEPLGAFLALEPRVDLAQELLSHGCRDEGREVLVDCWTAAHEMGAGGVEQRIVRLATRTRVPLPESASSEGPLARLTPREREVLEQLAKGATNKAIAAELVITEKTASVHVSNVLAKLGVENRGEAAALARSLHA